MTGYRTVIIGALVTVIGAIQGLNFAELIPNNPQVVGAITSGLGIIMVVLRFLTSTPVGKSS